MAAGKQGSRLSKIAAGKQSSRLSKEAEQESRWAARRFKFLKFYFYYYGKRD